MHVVPAATVSAACEALALCLPVSSQLNTVSSLTLCPVHSTAVNIDAYDAVMVGGSV